MNLDNVNKFLRLVGYENNESFVDGYVQYLEDEDRLAYEDMMGTYACHSYDS